jgi:hypothetical protein
METPIITAALARKPRRCPRAIHRKGGEGDPKKRPDNFVAQGPKKKAGAPLGNRNATRPAPEWVDRHARMDALVRQLSALADVAMASARLGELGRARLTALLAEPRHD